MASLKLNFRTQFEGNLLCPQCKSAEDSQEHLLFHINDERSFDEQIIYKKLFSNDPDDNFTSITLLEKGFKQREKFITLPEDEI